MFLRLFRALPIEEDEMVELAHPSPEPVQLSEQAQIRQAVEATLAELNPRDRAIPALHYQGEDESLPREGALESYHKGAAMDDRLPADVTLDEVLMTRLPETPAPQPRRRWFWPAIAEFCLLSFLFLAAVALQSGVERWLIQPPILLAILSIEIACSVVLLWRARARSGSFCWRLPPLSVCRLRTIHSARSAMMRGKRTHS